MRPLSGVVAALLATSALWSTEPATFTVSVDVSQVPEARPYVEQSRELVTEWYPKINAILFGEDYPLPLKEVQVIFEPKSFVGSGADRIEVPAHEEEDIPRSIARIHINFSYLERVRYPYRATLIHELTHVNQQHKNYPEWLNEGMADYVRHKYFERDIEPNLQPLDGYYAGGKQMDQVKLRKEGYLLGYTIAAPFLFWLEKQKDPSLIVAVNRALRDGRYSPGIFQQRCGAPLDALWSEFIAQSPR
jgi:hypothetical protein